MRRDGAKIKTSSHTHLKAAKPCDRPYPSKVAMQPFNSSGE